MLKIISIATLILASINTYSQDNNKVISIVSENRDTLYLVDNSVGNMVLEVWDDSCSMISNKPLIIMKPENWILVENKRRKECSITLNDKLVNSKND